MTTEMIKIHIFRAKNSKLMFNKDRFTNQINHLSHKKGNVISTNTWQRNYFKSQTTAFIFKVNTEDAND